MTPATSLTESLGLIASVKMNCNNLPSVDSGHFHVKLKNYLMFFYLMGESPLLKFAKITKKTSRSERFIKNFWFLPAIFWFLVKLSVFIFGTILYCERNKQRHIPYLLSSLLYMIMETLVALTLHTNVFFHESTLKLALDSVQFLLDFCRSKFQFKISMDEYFRETCRTFIEVSSICLGAVFIYGAVRIFAIQRKDGYLSFFKDALYMSTPIGIMHFVFYINLIKYMMKQLNAILMQQHVCTFCKYVNYGHGHEHGIQMKCRQYLCDDIRLTSIKRMKLIYYRIWRATQHINDFFGWPVAAILMQNFVVISFSLYWLYIAVTTKIPDINIIWPISGPLAGYEIE